MNTPLGRGLIDGQVFYFRSSEDDVLVWILDRGYEFIWWSGIYVLELEGYAW